MKIYDEQGRLLEAAPDPETGWLEPTQRLVQHHPAVPAVPAAMRVEVMAGTEGLRHLVEDQPAVPAKDAWDEYEVVRVFHPYTPEQLEARSRPSLDDRMAAAEQALLLLMAQVPAPTEGGSHV